MPTQNEYMLSKQMVRENYVKIKLLNYRFQNVGEITGETIEQPSFTINSESDIRRTCSVSLTPRNSSFDISQGNKIWLDKYIQIYIGQKNVHTNDIEYTNMGIYLIENPQRAYSVSDNTLSFQGIDLMAKLTGLRNGNLQGLPYLIPQGSNVRTAIIAVLDMCGFTNYVVEECPIDVPNDIKIEIGGTAYDILTKLRDILPNYQMYFDVDGVFHYDQIPSGKDEPIMVDDDIWTINLLGYSKTTDFDSLKNSIEVFGKTHDIKNYGGQATIDNDTYKIELDGISELRKNTKIGFNTDTDVGTTKKLEVTTRKTKVDPQTGEVTTETIVVTYPIKTEKGVTPTFPSEDTYYVVKFMFGEDQWEFTNVQSAESPNVAIITDDTYIVNDSSIYEYVDGMEYTFRTPTSGCDYVYMPYFQINTFSKIPIHNTVKLRNDTTYTIKYNKASEDETLKYFQFMGEVTPYAQIEEDNEESPYYVNGTIGKINTVLSGGEYDNIYTTDLAKERAEWELYRNCRLLDSVTLDCVPIYWLDVNWLINITLPNKYGVEQTEQYIIKSINIGGGLGATQNITLMRYYPYYQE